MHPFSYIYALFNISPATLHRWCQRARITPHIDPADYRCRYLDDNQLLRLARLHYRVLMVDTGSVQLSALEILEARTSKIEAQIAKLLKGDQNTP
jgi:hypothetical protein